MLTIAKLVNKRNIKVLNLKPVLFDYTFPLPSWGLGRNQDGALWRTFLCFQQKILDLHLHLQVKREQGPNSKTWVFLVQWDSHVWKWGEWWWKVVTNLHHLLFQKAKKTHTVYSSLRSQLFVGVVMIPGVAFPNWHNSINRWKSENLR